MNQTSQASSEPPSASAEGIYLSRIFGFNTVRYKTLVDAIATGLAEYEAQQHVQSRGGSYVALGAPLPAA